MASVTSNIALNMSSATTWYGTIYSATSTEIIIYDSSRVAQYIGSNFTYSGNSVAGGTLTGYTQYQRSNATVQYQVSGLNISASSAASYVQSNNQYQLYTLALSGDDSITGSTYSDTLLGFSGNDSIYGGSGNDTLNGGTGTNILEGGEGNDTYLYSFIGADTISDTSGDDLVRVTLPASSGTSWNWNGTTLEVWEKNNSANKLSLLNAANIERISDGSRIFFLADAQTGSDSADLIVGLSTADNISAGNGADIVIALAGNDIVDAGSGDDSVFGASGDDTILGGAGKDTLDGEEGIDTADYSDKTAAISVTLNTSSVVTVRVNGIAEDTIKNIENIIGGSGNDVITGDSNSNVLIGGNGNDTLNGGAGADYLDGGVGIDTADYSGITQNIWMWLGGDTESSVSISADVFELLEFDTIVNIENFISGSGDDWLIGDSNVNQLIGGLGNDTLDGGAGADTLIGGAGNDIYYVDNTGDVVTELSKDNTVSQEKFSMGNNNDVIVASLSYTLAAGTTGIEDMMAEGSLTGSLNSNAINLTGNALGQGLIGNEATNVLNGMAGDDALVGAGGADTLIGGDGNDWFFSGTGNDSMLGGKGTDLFFFNFGASPGTNLVGDAGDFDLTGGSDTADGGEGATDVLLMKGTLANYNISRTALTQYVITTKEGIDGISSDEQITFQNIEYLKFGDLSELDSSPLVALSSINIVSSFNDTIRGTSGNDTLDGGAGADTLIGGLGDDIYIVDNIGDKTTEAAAQGTDTVRSSITWTALAANVENLTLTGTSDINGTGNTLNNIITGNSGNNILNGGAGNDTIDGGDGADTINGGDGNDTLSANAGGGAINGGVGNDTLYGGTGTDTLDGGAGNDILYNGGSGDTLIGGAGNDIYYVDSGPTTLRESANGGIDTIITSISFDLQWLTNHENLTLTGSNSLFGAGNSLANTIIGNDGDNRINGSLGNDTLTGGLGNDIFVFNTAPNRTSNVDRITDFNVTDDTIQLEDVVFTGLGSATGTLDSSMFRSGAGVTTAGDSSDRIIYNTTSGALFYDADGTGATAAVQIALIGNQANLTVADLVVI